MRTAIEDNIEVSAEYGDTWVEDYAEFTLSYKMDLKSLFDLVSEIKIGGIADKAKINASLVRKYKSGFSKESAEQLDKIEKALHALGEELLSVQLVR